LALAAAALPESDESVVGVRDVDGSVQWAVVVIELIGDPVVVLERDAVDLDLR
jgi:hypothetical protein